MSLLNADYENIDGLRIKEISPLKTYFGKSAIFLQLVTQGTNSGSEIIAFCYSISSNYLHDDLLRLVKIVYLLHGIEEIKVEDQ